MGFFDSLAEAFSPDAGVQAAAGNGEHAERALANQASALITTAGTVGDFVVGAPLGAIAGGTLASGAGVVAEYGISTIITDEKVKGDTGDISATRFATEMALGGAGGMLGGGGATAAFK